MNYFITPLSLKFFCRFGIDTSFLITDPLLWHKNVKYQDAPNVFKKLKVVNDVAERDVLLIKKYNNILHKNEDQKQYCLQVSNEYQKNFPVAKKATLAKKF